MAVLSDVLRDKIRQALEDGWSSKWESVVSGRQAIREAVNAMDDYMNNNAAAINNSLPADAKANLTTSQKALLLTYVVAERYKVEV